MTIEVIQLTELTEGGNMRNRTAASWFLIAFIVIGTITIIDGVNDGFSVLDWVVIAVCVVFALQAVFFLASDRSSRS